MGIRDGEQEILEENIAEAKIDHRKRSELVKEFLSPANWPTGIIN